LLRRGKTLEVELVDASAGAPASRATSGCWRRRGASGRFGQTAGVAAADVPAP
jgi:hypothetical protein